MTGRTDSTKFFSLEKTFPEQEKKSSGMAIRKRGRRLFFMVNKIRISDYRKPMLRIPVSISIFEMVLNSVK